MTPFEVAFGKKLDLKNVCEWGEKVYVRIEGGMKLGGRIHEGCWLGIDNESKGAHVYWPNKTVTIERNIYYNNTSVQQQEEENEVIGLTRNQPPIPPIIPIVQPPVNCEESAEDSEVEATTKRIRKPSHKVATLLGGNQTLPPGIQKPTDDWTAVVEACEDECTFAIEVQDVEALEPQNLKEAKGHSNWLLWKRAIEEELKSLREAGT